MSIFHEEDKTRRAKIGTGHKVLQYIHYPAKLNKTILKLRCSSQNSSIILVIYNKRYAARKCLLNTATCIPHTNECNRF